MCRVEITVRRGAYHFVETGYVYTLADAIRTFDPFQRTRAS